MIERDIAGLCLICGTPGPAGVRRRAARAGRLGLGRWRRGAKGPIEWILTARIQIPQGEGLMVIGRLFTGPMEQGWIPVDDDGNPMGAPTGSLTPPPELALGGAKAPPDAAN